MKKLCVFALLPAALGAVSLPASADAHVQTTLPAQNFGSLPQLMVDSGRAGFLHFDIASVLPAGYGAGTIEKAFLYLYVNRVIAPGDIRVRRACTSWTESSLAFANRPATCLDGDSNLSVQTEKTFVAVDVSRIVRDWMRGSFPNDGFVLETIGTYGGAAYFDSKENTSTGHAPRLELVFTGGPGPMGPAGPAGPQGPAGEHAEVQLGMGACGSGQLQYGVDSNGNPLCRCPAIVHRTLVSAINVGGTFHWPGSDETVGSGSCAVTIIEPIGRIDSSNDSWRVRNKGPFGRCEVVGLAPRCGGYVSYVGSNDFPVCTSASYATSGVYQATAFVFCQ